MPVKMTGAQYKAFLASDWGPNAMWEETEVLRNGEPVPDDRDSDPSLFSDADEVTIVAGSIIPDQNASASEMSYVDAVKFARKWLKSQSTVTLMVEVPRECADRFVDMIAGLGISPGGTAKVVGRLG